MAKEITITTKKGLLAVNNIVFQDKDQEKVCRLLADKYAKANGKFTLEDGKVYTLEIAVEFDFGKDRMFCAIKN